MEELLSIYEKGDGLHLKDCIYKIREWFQINKKGTMDAAVLTTKFSMLLQFVNDLLSPVIDSTCNSILVVFSSVIDIFLRVDRKLLKRTLGSDIDTWSGLLRSLLCLTCDEKIHTTCRAKDASAVIKQIRILQTTRIFLKGDTDIWITNCSKLLERSKCKAHDLQRTTSACGSSYVTTESGNCLATDFIEKAPKKRKYDEENVIQHSDICDDSAGGLQLYRVCYLIELLSKKLDIPLVTQQIAQEIFHSFIITSSNRMTFTLKTKSFANYCDIMSSSRFSTSRDAEDKKFDIDIFHFSDVKSTIDKKLASDFWCYSDADSSVSLSNRGYRQCEKYVTAISAASVLLASKVTLDTEYAHSIPKPSTLLKKLKLILSETSICERLFDNDHSCVMLPRPAFCELVTSYEMQFLHCVQYDVTHWLGTIESTVRLIFLLCEMYSALKTILTFVCGMNNGVEC